MLFVFMVSTNSSRQCFKVNLAMRLEISRYNRETLLSVNKGTFSMLIRMHLYIWQLGKEGPIGRSNDGF